MAFKEAAVLSQKAVGRTCVYFFIFTTWQTQI
jgi:hypothetical protein